MIPRMMIVLFLLSCVFTVKSQAQDNSALEAVVSVTGYVYDGATREPVNGVKVTFTKRGHNPNIATSNKGGYYLVTSLEPGETYVVRVEKPGFFQDEFEYSVPNTNRYQEVSRDLLVQPLRKGATIPVYVHPFELNKSKLKVGASEFLDEVAHMLRLNPNVSIEISCYPDSDENESANMKMTNERCDAIRSYLTSKGVEAKRLSIRAFGETDPRNPKPIRKTPKGKRYIGSVYMTITSI